MLDPGFDTDQLVSGVQISPDNAAIVHHVIVSKVEPDQVDTAKALDAKDPARRLHLLRRGRDRRRRGGPTSTTPTGSVLAPGR